MGRGGKARVKALERRTLRVGVRIVIRVTRKGAYGKYTRISVYKRQSTRRPAQGLLRLRVPHQALPGHRQRVSPAEGDPPRPRADDGRDLLFLSDLHLAAGSAGLVDRFTHDEALVRLLGRFDADAPLVRVVLLGDFVYFLEVRRRRGRSDASDAATLPRLDAIVAAHPAASRRCGRFPALGGR